MATAVITVPASRLRSFGESRDSTFCVITGPGMGVDYYIEPGPKYADALVLEYDGAVSFGRFLADTVPRNAHLLVILPDFYFRSPSPEDLGPDRKLAVMACSSTPTTPEAIAHFIGIGEKTDPALQEAMVERFFECGEATDSLRFVSDEYDTVAEFQHLGDELSWHEQAGSLDWGEQQLFPSGEVSVLPVNVFGQNIEAALPITGTLALRGWPVLHSGMPSFLPSDQQRLFDQLATLEHDAVLATVENGVVTDLQPTSPSCVPAVRALTALCDVDSRYRTVLELGFGINTALTLFAGNSAMNEVYGGSAGAVHIGFGLTPFTQYHLDIICPGIRLENSAGRVILGEPRFDDAVEALPLEVAAG